MSTLKVNKLRDTSGSTDAIVLDPSGGAVLAGVTTVSTVKVGSGVTISSDGDVFATGVSTCLGTALSGSVIVGSAVTITESGIEASGIGITCANINGGHIGGRRNKIINGAIQVNQRGGTTSSPAYGVDRWWQVHGGSATMAQDATVPSGEGFSYSMKLSNVSGDVSIGQPIELDATGKQSGFPAGKKMTFSFYAKCESGTDGIAVYAMFRESKYSATNQVIFTGHGTSVTLTTTWTRHVVTMTIPTCHSGSTIVAFEIGGITGTSYFTGFQAEIGDQATAFEHCSFGEEFSLCQRYYVNFLNYDGQGTNPESNLAFAVGTWYNSTYIFCPIRFPVPMRTGPTLESSSGTNDFYALYGAHVDYYNENGLLQASNMGARIYPIVGTANQGSSGTCTVLHVELASTAQLRFNAEL